uniref:X-box-binding protein 1 n=1 Tax=Lygus hesperus TaxID=30085 RepID=A0A146L566_LYGHE
MVATKFCRPRLMIKPEKDKIREMMIASVNNYAYAISLGNGEENQQTSPPPPRKRRRLDNLTPEEKMRRKKLKNREAAQTSRDKKKAYVTHLEETLKALREENKRLAYQMMIVAEEKDELARKNETLEKELKAATAGGSGSRPAAPLNPLQKDHPRPPTVLSVTLPWTMLTLMWTLRTSNGSTTSPVLPLTSKSWEKWPTAYLKKPSNLRMKKRPERWWGPSKKTWNPLAHPSRPPKTNPLLTS